MIKGKTESGFEFEIDEKRADDMEVLEDLVAIKDDALRFPGLLNKMLGEDQKKRLYDHLRLPDGRVPIESLDKEFTEIMNLAGESAKNS